MYGVIDIGSNTVRFLVYNYVNGHIDKVLSKKYVVGLVSYIDEDHVMNEEGIKELLDIMDEIRLFEKLISLDDFFIFATAALRNIKNRDEVLFRVRNECGYEIDVLSGEQEAGYAFGGAMSENECKRGVVVDIGGGSTEIICFDDGKVISSDSLAMGTLSEYNSFVSGVMPEEDEIQAIRADIEEKLSDIHAPAKMEDADAYWVGGTGRAVLRIIKEIYHMYRKEPDGFREDRYDAACVESLLDFYKKNTKICDKVLVKFVPDRLHTFIPGLLIFAGVTKTFNVGEVITSVGGVREGYLLEKLREKGMA